MFFFKKLNLSNFITNNVTNMGYMFANYFKLKELNVSNFNTNNVTNMGDMFSTCFKLKELNVSNFNTIVIPVDKAFPKKGNSH